MDATERIAAGDRDVRVRPRGPRRVKAMVESFNTMAERLDGSERQRRALLADVTHELRTPLTVMQADLEALLDGVHPRDDERIGALLDETKVMSRLVDDLRTLSIADAGALELHREQTDVGELVAEAVASFRSRAAAAGVALSSDVSGDPPPLDIDPVRIREVVANLLDNAIRHTPSGGRVTVQVERTEGGVAIAVSDTGSGIAAEELPRVFERFTKGSGSRGSGLGLAIARGLVRAHGGEVEATSDGAGKGTTVRFTLPSA
jgi:signal transduction histidine kinase